MPSPVGPHLRLGFCPETLVKIGLLAVAALCLFTSFSSLRAYHSALPTGCDDFGYLYQAEAVRGGRLLGEHTPRPFLMPLVNELSNSCQHESDYMWMVAPHAYHYVPAAERIVNQYPPGTAFVLAGFHKEIRGLAYPIVVTTSLILLLVLAWREKGWRLAACGSAVIFVASANLVMHPFVEQYRHVGSLAPTFALLIAAGWLMRKHPAAALALASVTVIFRIPNAWLLPVVALPFIFTEYFAGGDMPDWRTIFIRAVKAACIILAAGVAWILLYQWILLGGPLRFTYSPIDRETATLSDMLVNARFYLNPMQRNWFTVHLVALALAALAFSGTKRRWLWLALFLTVWNYAFFITHKVTTPYYTYASSLILIGICLSHIGELKERLLKTATIIFTGLSVLALFSALTHANPPSTSVAIQTQKFENAFAGTQVAWAELSTGTIEYATGIPAMRMNWGTASAAKTAFVWLHDNGYTQAVMIDDKGMKPENAFAVINSTGLAYTIRKDANLGRIAIIEPHK